MVPNLIILLVFTSGNANTVPANAGLLLSVSENLRRRHYGDITERSQALVEFEIIAHALYLYIHRQYRNRLLWLNICST